MPLPLDKQTHASWGDPTLYWANGKPGKTIHLVARPSTMLSGYVITVCKQSMRYTPVTDEGFQHCSECFTTHKRIAKLLALQVGTNPLDSWACAKPKTNQDPSPVPRPLVKRNRLPATSLTTATATTSKQRSSIKMGSSSRSATRTPSSRFSTTLTRSNWTASNTSQRRSGAR